MENDVKYYASLEGVTKQIKKNVIKDYFIAGYSVWEQIGNRKIYYTQNDFPDDSHFNTKSNTPYNYESVDESVRLEPVVINGEQFFNYSSILCVNTKTYVNEPERTQDGSIPDINDIETFFVPRLKIKFDYISISDFHRMLKAISPNEFTVIYFDSEKGKKVSYQMYVEPREMAELYNVGYEILGVLGYEFSFIGTLNNLKTIKIKYYNESVEINYVAEPYGQIITIMESSSLVVPEGKHFVKWNTKQDGTGQNYLPNQKIAAVEDMNLYAIWEDGE